MGTLDTRGLSSLRSDEQLSLLDEIDEFSRSGVGDHVSLPQIAVCGDQSSGKSSCLEAISGVPFPRKDTLCTRFATELVLRKSSLEIVIVKIIASQQRPENERLQLEGFQHSLKSFDELPALIDHAKTAMGLDKPGSGFSSDILRIEISGPTRPHLTLVDLPGLIYDKNDDEDDEDVEEVVSELVQSYMCRPRTIILAVVSAMNDRALQAVLKRAKQVDPHGRRTMGLITKPDALPKDSESEREFVKLALNQATHLRLGWHVLRNRDFSTRDVTSSERDRFEEQFFSQGVWKTLPRSSLGVAKLRDRLSKVLLDHIKSELPALIGEIQNILDETQQALLKLGDHRSTVEEQRLYLLKHSQYFTIICKASCDGAYEHKFFGDLAGDVSKARRFRAVVQNLNLAFKEIIRLKGQQRKLLGDGLEGKSKEAIAWAQDTLTSSRGRELPGTFNPMLIGELFRVQSKPWEDISKIYIKNVWERARKHVEDILSTLMDIDTCGALLLHWIDPLMGKMLKTANYEMDRLFRDRNRHAVTYNHYFTEDFQKISNDRNERRLLAVLEKSFPLDLKGERRVGPRDLAGVCSIMSKTIPDMNTLASIELLDRLEAYYKVAMKIFVDNVAVQVVDASIVNNLADIFTPLAVLQTTRELTAKIAVEPSENQLQRGMLEKKLDMLEKGIETCKRHTIRNVSDLISIDPPSQSTETTSSTPPSVASENVPEMVENVEPDTVVEEKEEEPGSQYIMTVYLPHSSASESLSGRQGPKYTSSRKRLLAVI